MKKIASAIAFVVCLSPAFAQDASAAKVSGGLVFDGSTDAKDNTLGRKPTYEQIQENEKSDQQMIANLKAIIVSLNSTVIDLQAALSAVISSHAKQAAAKQEQGK